MMRIGIFGGSFDPVHIGHLWIAEAALESLQLDEIRWIPAATSPLKPGGPIASNEDRLQMVRLAVSGCQKHVVDDREIARGDVSYTVDTLEQIAAEHTDAELFLIIGSDSLASFPHWRKPERVLELATLAVVRRGGKPEIDWTVLAGLADPERIAAFADHVVSMPVIELSSTGLRRRISKGQSIRFQVPRAVEAFIDVQKLYQT